MTDPIKPLDWSHSAADIPAAGRAFTREATETERLSVANALGLLGCAKLSASYKIRPIGGGRYRLEGPLAAEVTQACVVSLKPVPSTYHLPLDVDFCNEMPSPETAPDDEAEVSNLPDVALIENGRLDVGAVVFDALSAGLDPFPRADGESFDWSDPKDAGGKHNPFAALQKLKDNPGR